MTRWEDPGPGRSRENIGPWAAVVEDLHRHPGWWALVAEDMPSRQVTEYLKRRYKVEAVSRINDDGTFRIYARVPKGDT